MNPPFEGSPEEFFAEHCETIRPGAKAGAAEGKLPAMSVLSRTSCPPPTLPLHVFGEFWSELLKTAAEGANSPVDYVALPLLALIGNSRWVVAWSGWAEPPVLWCCSVGDPSSGKSSGANPVMRDVLKHVEKHMCRDFPRQVEEHETIASVARAVLKKWEKDTAIAVKNKKPIPEKPPEATVPPKPLRPRARVSDVTLEALSELLSSLPKGVLCQRDELAGWFGNMSRYANGGNDRPFWLEAYNGGAHVVDRVKNPDPTFIPHLSVSICGTIQPGRLADVLEDTDDGLPSRFLWTWPDAKPFAQPKVTADTEGAGSRLLALADLAMAKDEAGQEMPAYIHLDNKARTALVAFGQEMQRREEAAHGLMKGTLGKARGQCLRLALVLEYLWWSASGATVEPSNISEKALTSAIDLMDTYFIPMASRVLGDAAMSADARNARTLAKWICERRPATVNVSSIRDEARLPGLRESGPVKAAVQFLVEANWLFPAPETGGRGRPRGDFIVNPLVWKRH
jgi:hypothetical protein